MEAADELFAAEGFDAVSVSDIAARADVGRTTFFRYFGDKTEVVFAKEQAILDMVAGEADRAGVAARTLHEAVEQLRPIVLAVCEHATVDPEEYARHALLVQQHPELSARDAVKAQQIAGALGDVLTSRGTDGATAALAAQVALACYQAVRRSTDAARSLTRRTEAAFQQVLALGRG